MMVPITIYLARGSWSNYVKCCKVTGIHRHSVIVDAHAAGTN